MIAAAIGDARLKPRTLREIREHYWAMRFRTGKAAKRVRIWEGLHIPYRTTGDPPSDETKTEIEWRDPTIEEAAAELEQALLDEAAAGNWFAFGRRGPDEPFELIRPRYWDFLTLDINKNAALGEQLSFRGLQCWLSTDRDPSDRIFEELRAGQQMPTLDLTAESAKDLPAPGNVGRPSMSRLVLGEFKRRVESNEFRRPMRQEALYLKIWVREKFPHVKSHPQLKTIENNLRRSYRAAQMTRGEAPTK